MKASSKPSKQRKLLWNAPLHRRYRHMVALLSIDLRLKYDRRSLHLRKDDTVKIVRGDYAGLEGKIRRVIPKDYRITVEGVTKEKGDGTKRFVPIHPSKVVITKLNLSDKWRSQRLKEKPGLEVTEEEAEEAGKAEEAEKEKVE